MQSEHKINRVHSDNGLDLLSKTPKTFKQFTASRGYCLRCTRSDKMEWPCAPTVSLWRWQGAWFITNASTRIFGWKGWKTRCWLVIGDWQVHWNWKQQRRLGEVRRRALCTWINLDAFSIQWCLLQWGPRWMQRVKSVYLLYLARNRGILYGVYGINIDHQELWRGYCKGCHFE